MTKDKRLNPLRQLYPRNGQASLEGLYLGQDLRSRAVSNGVFVYSNFIASLDGRIAVAGRGDDSIAVPKETVNSRDWRLLLELAAPADALIVSGRYIRELAAGVAQSAPPLEGAVPPELLGARSRWGLSAQPALVVVSSSLRLPLQILEERCESRRVIVVTGDHAAGDGVRSLEDAGIEILSAGARHVDGARMIRALADRDLNVIYSVAGPAVLQTLLQARVLHRLYLTTVLRILSGQNYATLARGPLLDPPYDFELAELYLDPCGPDGVPQMLQVFDRAAR